MTPQELRNSIISKAIAGKLVNQVDEEEPVEVAVFGGDCDELFEIPKSWRWASLKSVVTVNTGLSFKKEEQLDINTGNLRVLRGGNIGDNFNYCFLDNDIFVKKENFAGKFIALKKGDIITPAVTSIEKICKTGYIERDFDSVTAGGFVYIIRVNDDTILYPKYLKYFISSSFNKTQCKPNIHKSGQAFYNLKKSGYIEQPICIPPLEEQKRIVAKIEELLPLVDKYEEAWTKLEKFNNQFPIDMERSILQYAMQGKLVKSAPSEGTGQELLISILKTVDKKKINKYEKINIENCPFEIPLNWEWVRLGMIFNHSAGKALNSSDREGKEYQYITTSNVYWNSFDLAKTKTMFYKESELERCSAKKGDLLVLEGGDVGRAAIWNYDYDIRIQNHIHCIRNVNHLNIKFFYFLFFLYKSIGFINGKGIGIQGLSANVLDNLVLPLPPVEEQNRIVKKIEELLPLCRSLK